MSDLIDKKGLIEYLDGEDLTYIEDFYNAIRRAPAVDAVEVVRCLDCKYWGDEEGIAEGRDFRYARCNVHNHFRYGEHIGWCPKEDDFCSFGERREEDEVD